MIPIEFDTIFGKPLFSRWNTHNTSLVCSQDPMPMLTLRSPHFVPSKGAATGLTHVFSSLDVQNREPQLDYNGKQHINCTYISVLGNDIY